MANHIHLLVVLTTENGLNRVLKPLHMQYVQRINREKAWQAIYGKGVISLHHWMICTV